MRRRLALLLLLALSAGAAEGQEISASSIDRFAVSAGTFADLKLGSAGPYLDLRTPPFLLGRQMGLHLRYQGGRRIGSLLPDIQTLRAELAWSVGSAALAGEGGISTFRLGADLTWSDRAAAPPNGSFVAGPELGSDLSLQSGRSHFMVSDTLAVSGLGAGFSAAVGYGFELFPWLLMSARVTSATALSWGGAVSVDLYPYLYVTVFVGR